MLICILTRIVRMKLRYTWGILKSRLISAIVVVKSWWLCHTFMSTVDHHLFHWEWIVLYEWTWHILMFIVVIMHKSIQWSHVIDTLLLDLQETPLMFYLIQTCLKTQIAIMYGVSFRGLSFLKLNWVFSWVLLLWKYWICSIICLNVHWIAPICCVCLVRVVFFP